MALATERAQSTRRQRRLPLAAVLLAAVAVHSLLGLSSPWELEAFAAKRAVPKAKAKASPSKSARSPAGPPVRPRNAYMLFANDRRSAVAKKGMSMPDVARALGEEWRGLTASKKSAYQKKAEQDKKRFETERAAFEGSGGVMPARRSRGEKAKTKRPPTAYALYVKERFPEIKRKDESMSLGEISKILGSEWKKLKPAKKAKYQQESAELREEMLAA